VTEGTDRQELRGDPPENLPIPESDAPSHEPREDDPMHIHRPKPLRSVREFLGEVGVIVVGIVIALTLEQAVEWLHWHAQVERTEAALQAELKTNFVFAYERRVLDVCVNDRIAILRDRLLEPGPHWMGVGLSSNDNGFYRKTPMPPVFGIPFRPRRMEAWQTALASGVLNYMPSARVAIYARIYDQVAMMKQTQDAEIPALHQVGGLAFNRDLTTSDRTAYLDRLETIANLNRMMVGESGQLLHAPFALGADAFHLSQAEASVIVSRARAMYGSCVIAATVPTVKDPPFTFWFTVP
jgi:hypothetical protein